MIALILAACGTATPPSETPERPELPPPLELPDIEGVDFESSFRESLELALSVDARTVATAHQRAVSNFVPGCPDVYLGIPPENVAGVDADDGIGGFTWSDNCAQANSDLTFSGYGYWDGAATAKGQTDSAEGRTIEGSRNLIADGVMADDSGILFEFDGTASDAVSLVEAEGYTRWSYTSLVEGTATGSDVFQAGSLSPLGWRTDLYLELVGGAEERTIIRGNAYLFDGRLAERFDSIAMDIELVGESSAGPDDCTLEPRGWMGLRDENAIWYDLVFLPRYEGDITGQPYPNDPLQACDGCGTLYIRGVEQGEICPDLSGLFSTEPPTIEGFSASIRDVPDALEAP